ncbi:MAG TPA: rod shape-determining protein MreD [Flavobacteriales bacterium]|jgi:hypothetical protein|nr:rod shape-determining protein MreD [Flavobacteriales bacterium]
MRRVWIWNALIRAILAIALQLLVFNNLYLGTVLNPTIYVYIIIFLPLETPFLLLILLGFILGFIEDMALGTWGLHMMAATLIAYTRWRLIKVLEPRDGYEAGIQPKLYDFGWGPYLTYSLTSVFLFSIFLYLVESLGTIGLWRIIFMALMNTTVVVFLIVVFEIMRKKSNRGNG